MSAQQVSVEQERVAVRPVRYDVDLFSDNRSPPSPEMLRFMAEAEVGDEEQREDPTVLELEALVAELTGKEDAVYMPSGTMCNLVAFAVHCEPDDVILIEESSHPVYSGYAGPRVPGRPSLQTLAGAEGVIDPANIERVLRDADAGRSARLLSLENTHNRSGGSIWPLARLDEVCGVAHDHGLVVHLDGARLLNAVVASGISTTRFCAPVDSIWIDLSKGLGCPSGAVMSGSFDFVTKARVAKYIFGGVTHKAGLAAAAGIYALRHNVNRLAEDNAKARELAAGLELISGVRIDQPRIDTNLVYFDVGGAGLSAPELAASTQELGVRFKPAGPTRLRAALHLGVAPEHIPRAVAAIREAVASPSSPPVPQRGQES